MSAKNDEVRPRLKLFRPEKLVLSAGRLLLCSLVYYLL